MENKRGLLLSLSIILLFFGSTVLFSEELLLDSGVNYFLGNIAEAYPIQVSLTIKDGDVSGFYFYESTGEPLILKGSLSGGVIVMTEVDENGKETGAWVLRSGSDEPGVFYGDWTAPNRTKTFSIDLRKVIETRSLKSELGSYLEFSASYPFFKFEAEKMEHFGSLNSRLFSNVFANQQAFFEFAAETDFGYLYTSSYPWNSEAYYSVEYFSADLVSIYHGIYEYSGGAHGNYFILGENYHFDGDQWDTVDFSDLFKRNAPFVKDLSVVLIEDLRTQDAMYVVDEEITSFSIDELEGKYVITRKGLIFHFSPYEVGPYVQGEFEVLVPYEAIKRSIDSRGLLGRFLD